MFLNQYSFVVPGSTLCAPSTHLQLPSWLKTSRNTNSYQNLKFLTVLIMHLFLYSFQWGLLRFTIMYSYVLKKIFLMYFAQHAELYSGFSLLSGNRLVRLDKLFRWLRNGRNDIGWWWEGCWSRNNETFIRERLLHKETFSSSSVPWARCDWNRQSHNVVHTIASTDALLHPSTQPDRTEESSMSEMTKRTTWWRCASAFGANAVKKDVKHSNNILKEGNEKRSHCWFDVS